MLYKVRQHMKIRTMYLDLVLGKSLKWDVQRRAGLTFELLD